MSDSTEQNNEGFIAFTQKVSAVLRDFFNAKREQHALAIERKKAMDEVTARYDALTRPHAEKEAELKQQLIDMIWPMKAKLISKDRKSASTPYGTIEFKWKPVTNSLTDKKGAERQARSDRRLTELFEKVTTWKPRTSVLTKLMKSDPAFAKRYAPFFTASGGFDELRVRPSDRFFNKFDKNRLTDESDNLGSDPNDVQAPSPDA